MADELKPSRGLTFSQKQIPVALSLIPDTIENILKLVDNFRKREMLFRELVLMLAVKQAVRSVGKDDKEIKSFGYDGALDQRREYSTWPNPPIVNIVNMNDGSKVRLDPPCYKDAESVRDVIGLFSESDTALARHMVARAFGRPPGAEPMYFADGRWRCEHKYNDQEYAAYNEGAKIVWRKVEKQDEVQQPGVGDGAGGTEVLAE